jgi:hypothetical protein
VRRRLQREPRHPGCWVSLAPCCILTRLPGGSRAAVAACMQRGPQVPDLEGAGPRLTHALPRTTRSYGTDAATNIPYWLIKNSWQVPVDATAAAWRAHCGHRPPGCLCAARACCSWPRTAWRPSLPWPRAGALDGARTGTCACSAT